MRVLILILLLAGWSNPQSNSDALKSEAQKQMSLGRYGEAIDLLNKYIAANPSKADGLHLRGLCYEKRNQFEYSVFDLRNARKLDTKNSEIIRDLDRVTTTWHQMLRKKIAGHKREIAVNPSIPVNYLEIGKSHKHLGEWQEAEAWYDEYIKREDPSPDEVIRYTEILAQNNHIEKGEKILKRYVEKFPKDHRLWSRYGYFTMWLGKKKIAIDAFNTALSFRPFFREAQEGLEQAENRPYIYTVVDTVVDLKKLQQQRAEKEYFIDRLFREVKSAPNDVGKRYSLIEALISVNRFEEAYQQLQILSVGESGTERFDNLWEFVTTKKDSLARFNIDKYKALYEADKNNKAVVMRLAELYAATMDYDSAIEILSLFVKNNKMDGNNDLRFMLAKYTAFNQQFEPSIEQLNILLKSEPDNYDYKLLRALVAVWTTTDLDLAKSLLEEYLVKYPESVEAIVAYANLMVKERKFTDAKALIDKARSINPNAREVESVQNYYDAILELEEDRKIFKILEEARELAVAQNCPDAVIKYDEYFSKIKSPSRFEWIEYADVNSCAKNFSKAIEVYDRLLEQEYDIDIAILRAKNYLWSGDSIRALSEFNRIVAEDSTSFDAKFYLAESYEVNKDYDSAKSIYERLLTETVDSNKIKIINLRLGWLPKGGGGLFSFDIPTFVRLAPVYNYYSDNQNLKYSNTGGQIEFGLTSFLSTGITFNRSTIETPGMIRFYTALKWNLLVNIDNKLYLNSGYGNLNYRNVRIRKVSDFGIRYYFDKNNNMSLTFENTDAAIVLYSAKLGFQNINANVYRFNWNFRTRNMLYISGYYHFLKLNDGNSGRDLQLRIGRKFDYDIIGGYEYLSTDYARYSSYYYSPQDFSAHSIWAEWEQKYDSTLSYTLGGKVGYIPASDFFIREISAAAIYQPFRAFFVSARISYGGTYRYDGSYEFLSAYILAYWNLF